MDVNEVLRNLISQLIDIAAESKDLPPNKRRFAREAGQFNMVVRVAMLAHPGWKAADYVAAACGQVAR